jgi:GT2 family glycosyltransferase
VPSTTANTLPEQSEIKSVLVIILNWNSPQETLSAVESVLKMNYANYRVLIIDNGSKDDSLEVLTKIDNERVELIGLPENLGYTGGCNIGFQKALDIGANYVWLLNSDSVTEVGTLSSLVRTAEQDSRIGLVSPLIASLQRPSIFVYAGGYFDALVPVFETTRDPRVAADWAMRWPDNILLLGTALLVKVDMIRKIGMLDANMFAYWEDTDFSVRSNKAGFRNVVDFTATVYHSEKFPTAEPENIRPHFWYYTARNEIRFWKKHASFMSRLKPLWWAYRLQLAHLNLVKGVAASRQAILAGMWDGWRNTNGPYRAGGHMPGLLAQVIEFHSRTQRS